MLLWTEAFIDSSNAETVFCVNGMPFDHCESLPTPVPVPAGLPIALMVPISTNVKFTIKKNNGTI